MPSNTLVTISRRSLRDNGPTATITDVKHLASYSWIESSTPTIAVPGIPPKWCPPAVAQRLPKDSGLVYIAQNAARHPESPMEPLFRALYIVDPAFDICAIDLVSDRNNLLKLLSFVNPSSSRNGLEAFTINVEVVGSTVIFCRTATKTKEVIAPHEFKGFGHEFERAYTTCAISDSTGHHRIVSYRFGGLGFVVRHEVDGYVDVDRVEKLMGSKSLDTDEEDLSSILGSLSLSTTGKSHCPIKATNKAKNKPTGSKLAIREQGHDVPIEATLEIKTRVSHKPLGISDVAPQLWASQTPKLVRAYHQNGLFLQPQVDDVTVEIGAWERSNQSNLKKLAALIKKILDVVKGFGVGNAVVNCDSVADKLVVKKVDGELMLPKDLYAKWDDDKEGTPKETSSSPPGEGIEKMGIKADKG